MVTIVRSKCQPRKESELPRARTKCFDSQSHPKPDPFGPSLEILRRADQISLQLVCHTRPARCRLGLTIASTLFRSTIWERIPPRACWPNEPVEYEPPHQSAHFQEADGQAS